MSRDVIATAKSTKWLPSQRWTWISVSLLQMVLIVALEAVIGVHFAKLIDTSDNNVNEGSGKSIVLYLFIFCFSQVFQVYLAVDAALNQNVIQVIAHSIFVVCLFTFSVFQFFQIREAYMIALDNDNLLVDPTKINFQTHLFPPLLSTIIILALLAIFYAYWAYRLYSQFDWANYRRVGADPAIQSIFRLYQTFIVLLKLDFFFFIAFGLQFLVLVRIKNVEFALTIFAIPGLFVALLLAFYAVRYENRYVMAFWFLGLLLAVCYFTYKIVRIHSPSQYPKYEGSGKFLSFFAALSLVMIFLSLVTSVLCARNFGKGLRDRLDAKPSRWNLFRRFGIGGSKDGTANGRGSGGGGYNSSTPPPNASIDFPLDPMGSGGADEPVQHPPSDIMPQIPSSPAYDYNGNAQRNISLVI
ncbi:hypothetical protein H696_04540 [Fonticula alba]|uniref:TRP C-terminal domain-containing protein n=1 Tax=Fonticula alba TaxID=691883 RepID=A0A058Z4D4_FONAL|nr:hypothetical protein H696_04540 [Fonticula alba]KCV69125.1 hypothetical protein H696_04540 [Fonticula alba]|eukprot:XP_009496696.1 hypothetical protein H696_04540 [Fonticula alba]